jgi:hypothetical protein
MMTAFSDCVILLNFLVTFLMNFLMIRWVDFSMMMIFQISTHSIFARMRISLLIAEMSIFELTMTKINESRSASDCLHSVIFLTIMSIVSLSWTSTWAMIQWMWTSRSHFSILQINNCNKYWSNYFFEHWIIRITVWQFVKMTIRRSLKWFFVMFRARSSFTIFLK